MRGAALSEGGKPIIAIPSRTNKGVARIVHMLKPCAGVVTTRAHVHNMVTEYGIANLWGKNEIFQVKIIFKKIEKLRLRSAKKLTFVS